MLIKRYKPHLDQLGEEGEAGMQESPTGDYVTFDDHQTELRLAQRDFRKLTPLGVDKVLEAVKEWRARRFPGTGIVTQECWGDLRRGLEGIGNKDGQGG